MIFTEHALYATAISSHYELCIAIYTPFQTMFPMKICFKAIMGYVLLFLCLLQRTFTVQMIHCLAIMSSSLLFMRLLKENVHYTKSLSSYNELCIVLYFAIYKIFPVANSPWSHYVCVLHCFLYPLYRACHSCKFGIKPISFERSLLLMICTLLSAMQIC